MDVPFKTDFDDLEYPSNKSLFDDMKLLGGRGQNAWLGQPGTSTVTTESMAECLAFTEGMKSVIREAGIVTKDVSEQFESWLKEKQTRDIIAKSAYSEFSTSKLQNESREFISLGKTINALSNELDAVYEEYNAEGWDGYEAEGVGLNVYCEAKKVLTKIINQAPSKVITNLDISPAADGSIVFEWWKDDNSILTITTSGKEEVVIVFVDECSETGGKVNIDKLEEYMRKTEKLFFG